MTFDMNGPNITTNVDNDYPLVSICIPAFKVEHFRKALRSAIVQTYPRVEVIVSDDSAGEDIRAVCEQESHERLRYLKNPNPGNMGRNNIDYLVEESHGLFIKFLFDDDVLSPDCVDTMMAMYRAMPAGRISMIFSASNVIDSNDVVLKFRNPLAIGRPSIASGKLIASLIATQVHNFVGELSTVLIPKSLITNELGDSQLFKAARIRWRGLGDVGLWLELASVGDFAISPKPLSSFRVHHRSNSNPSANPDFIYCYLEWEAVIIEAVNKGFITNESDAARGFLKLADIYCKSGVLLDRARFLSSIFGRDGLSLRERLWMVQQDPSGRESSFEGLRHRLGTQVPTAIAGA